MYFLVVGSYHKIIQILWRNLSAGNRFCFCVISSTLLDKLGFMEKIDMWLNILLLSSPRPFWNPFSAHFVISLPIPPQMAPFCLLLVAPPEPPPLFFASQVQFGSWFQQARPTPSSFSFSSSIFSSLFLFSLSSFISLFSWAFC